MVVHGFPVISDGHQYIMMYYWKMSVLEWKIEARVLDWIEVGSIYFSKKSRSI